MQQTEASTWTSVLALVDDVTEANLAAERLQACIESWKMLSEPQESDTGTGNATTFQTRKLHQLIKLSASDNFTLDLTELVTLVAANISKLTAKQQSGLGQAMEKVVAPTWASVLPLITITPDGRSVGRSPEERLQACVDSWTVVSQAEKVVSGECANAYDHLYKLVPHAAGDEFTLDLTELVTLVAANITKLTVKQQSGLRQAMEKVEAPAWASVLPLIENIVAPERGSGRTGRSAEERLQACVDSWTMVSQAETAVPVERSNAYDHLYKLVPYAAGDEFTLDLTELVTLVAANITKLTVKQQSGLKQAMEKHNLGSTWTIAWPACGSGDSHGQMDLSLDVNKKQLPPQQAAPIQAAAPALKAAAPVRLSVS